ncbi:MAG: DMT family transporter [Robiginitomaculum sp.]|nr:DMT family transporter [Robiginitomaculum sp.]
MANEQFYFFFLMFLAGVGIPVMAAMNASLGRELQSPMVAVLILCCVALAIASLFVMFSARPTLESFKQISPIYYFGGVLFMLYIASITYTAPIIGIGNAVFFVLLGQLITAVLIDHYGLLNAPVSAVTYKRIFGIMLMIVGVYLAKKDVIPPNLIQ